MLAILPAISVFPLFMFFFEGKYGDPFDDIELDCMIHWLALPLSDPSIRWLALTILAEELSEPPTETTFLDGLGMETDDWEPGGYTKPRPDTPAKCHSGPFSRGVRECISHRSVPISAVDMKSLKLFGGTR